MSFLLAARSIERIGDHATRLSNNLRKINEKTTVDKKFVETSHKVMEIYDGAVNALYRKDIKHAHDIIEKSKNFQLDIEKLREEILALKKTNVLTIVSLIYMIDSIDRIRGYAENIAETAINHYFVA